MTGNSCCFTGHRIIPETLLPRLKERLRQEIITHIENGTTEFFAGGALGFDTLAAIMVLELKWLYPHIRLHLLLPCLDQTVGWEKEDEELYYDILKQADTVNYITERYHPGCMQKRNRCLVDSSSSCICYITKGTGGTAYTVGYAQKKGLSVRFI